jgi:hypothetical protein
VNTKPGVPSDLEILSVAANQLFENTSKMSSDAVASLMLALQHVSSSSMAVLGQSPGAVRYAGGPRLYSSLVLLSG